MSMHRRSVPSGASTRVYSADQPPAAGHPLLAGPAPLLCACPAQNSPLLPRAGPNARARAVALLVHLEAFDAEGRRNYPHAEREMTQTRVERRKTVDVEQAPKHG
eukprot:731633-Prymnesium_polylepis.2